MSSGGRGKRGRKKRDHLHARRWKGKEEAQYFHVALYSCSPGRAAAVGGGDRRWFKGREGKKKKGSGRRCQARQEEDRKLCCSISGKKERGVRVRALGRKGRGEFTFRFGDLFFIAKRKKERAGAVRAAGEKGKG